MTSKDETDFYFKAFSPTGYENDLRRTPRRAIPFRQLAF